MCLCLCVCMCVCAYSVCVYHDDDNDKDRYSHKFVRVSVFDVIIGYIAQLWDGIESFKQSFLLWQY